MIRTNPVPDHPIAATCTTDGSTGRSSGAAGLADGPGETGREHPSVVRGFGALPGPVGRVRPEDWEPPRKT